MIKLVLFFCVISSNLFSSDALLFDTKAQEKQYLELVETLSANVSESLQSREMTTYFHEVESVSPNGDQVTLTDQSRWGINWWHRSVSKGWKKGDKLQIDWSSKNPADFLFKNIGSNETAWGSLINLPDQESLPVIQTIMGQGKTIVLNNDLEFSSHISAFNPWIVEDTVFILQNSSGKFDLWNTSTNTIVSNCTSKNFPSSTPVYSPEIQKIIDLEHNLNQNVFNQESAIETLSLSLINYAAGLKQDNRPIGVFLFLGPTGVGKTELAKSLAQELYSSPSKLIRFDMSQFAEQYTLSRLFGAAPGYVNHEEGGQLTEAIKKNPKSIVLLDEMEKAHPNVHKSFLPIFDDARLSDHKNRIVKCEDIIFIMTSNLCSKEITELFNLNYTEKEILSVIEPLLMEKLSPELYNRVEPVIFKPISLEVMGNLVNKMLKNVQTNLLKSKQIQVDFDETVIEYLIREGFHPALGARPLRNLVDKRVVSTIALACVKNELVSGTHVILYYDEALDQFYF